MDYDFDYLLKLLEEEELKKKKSLEEPKVEEFKIALDDLIKPDYADKTKVNIPIEEKIKELKDDKQTVDLENVLQEIRLTQDRSFENEAIKSAPPISIERSIEELKNKKPSVSLKDKQSLIDQIRPLHLPVYISSADQDNKYDISVTQEPKVEDIDVTTQAESPETGIASKLRKVGEFLGSDSGQELLRALTIATNQPGSSGVKAAEYLEELHQADLLNRAVNAEDPEERVKALKHMKPETIQTYEGMKTAKVQREKAEAETENIRNLFEQQFKLAEYDAFTQERLLNQTYKLKQELAKLEEGIPSLDRTKEMQNIINTHIKDTEDLLREHYGEEIRTVDGDIQWTFKNPIAYNKALYKTIDSQLEYAVNTGLMTQEDKELYVKKYREQFLNSLSESDVVKENLNNYPTEFKTQTVNLDGNNVVRDVLYVYDVSNRKVKAYIMDENGVEFTKTFNMRPEDIQKYSGQIPNENKVDEVARDMEKDIRSVLENPNLRQQTIEKYKKLGLDAEFEDLLTRYKSE